uniref:Uncharacterized protein n=1 Tax=viral metagenome TaxID=1070528 RepID=A0A6C0KZT8_9ZZZZ|tara:strand:+ start:11517 stop:12194 length:678 start_codon:yes stop_codon:yes gene_type:complete
MTEVESNNVQINGYHGGLLSDVPVQQLQKCSENEVKDKLSLDNRSSLNSDPAVVNMEIKQSEGSGNYILDNMYGCDCGLETARELQLSQPSVNFTGGKGWIGESGCLVEKDSDLRFKESTNKRYINQLNNLTNQGFFGKGSYNVDVESIIRDSDSTKISRSCNVLSGSSTYDLSITPMIERLEKEVQNPQTIIPEDSMDSWVRGGLPSRQIVRNLEYMKRCQEKK